VYRTPALEQAIKRQIVQRTGARIQGLEIEVTDGRVVVYGCVLCFHRKQLALQGVLDVLGSNAARESNSTSRWWATLQCPTQMNILDRGRTEGDNM
jgi:hypothetical protein